MEECVSQETGDNALRKFSFADMPSESAEKDNNRPGPRHCWIWMFCAGFCE